MAEKSLGKNSVEMEPCHWSAHLEDDEVVICWMSCGHEKAADEPRCVELKTDAESLTLERISEMQPELKMPLQVPSSSRPATMMLRGTMIHPVYGSVGSERLSSGLFCDQG